METGNNKSQVSWRLVVVAVTLALALGACLGFVLAPVKTPGLSLVSDDSKEISTPTIKFLDPKRLPVTATLLSGGELAANAPGTITAYTCTPGDTIKSGTSFISLDGQPLLALHTEVPLWRDLQPDTNGVDVNALQAELQRLGYPVTPSGKWNQATSLALKQLWSKLGVRDTQSLPKMRLIWIPAVEVGVKACSSKLGTEIGAGTSVAAISDVISALKVDPVPDTARMAVAGKAKVEIPPDGKITDSAFLAAFAATSSYRAWSENPESQQLNVTAELKNPLSAISVPAAALYGIDADTACVLSGKKAYRVRIVSSELGQTIVVAHGKSSGDSTLPKTVRVNPGKDAPPCAS